MFTFREPQEWWALGGELGLRPHGPTAGFGPYASFRQLERSLGPPAPPPAHWSHWLHGVYRGRPVLVINYESGSGSNRSTETVAVAQIDPPLFLGVSIAREGFLSDLFGGTDVQLGDPVLDAELRLGAFDGARLAEFLRPNPANASLLHALVRGVRTGMHVTDSTVVFSMRGLVSDRRSIATSLDEAIGVAAHLAARRASFPLTEAERLHVAEWRAYAEANGLTFDPSRMELAGKMNDTTVRIGLETNGGRMHTSVTVTWPQAFPVSLRLHKKSSLSFLASLFTDEIVTGDLAFDDRFSIQGSPEASVRALFASAELRGSLVRLAPYASEVTMNGAGCFWLWPGAVVAGAHLDEHVKLALRMSHALFGSARAAGPFR